MDPACFGIQRQRNLKNVAHCHEKRPSLNMETVLICFLAFGSDSPWSPLGSDCIYFFITTPRIHLVKTSQ